MNILIQSCLFSPSVGGTETATRLLAIGLHDLGHQVKVATETEGDSPYTAGLEVHRKPSHLEFLRLVGWCDILIHSNISLRNVWPLLIRRRPWIIIHHTYINAMDDPRTSRLKQWVTRFASNVAVSEFMAGGLQAPSVVLENPYADDVFRIQPGVSRDLDIIMVGRLHVDKGFQVAIEALHRLHQRGYVKTRMTLVGEGPYLDELVALTKKLELQDAVEFTGIKSPEELARTFNRHQVLIVPSLTPETFGLVAIEGMACGCLVVASDVGSLKGTIGPAGVTFPAGDVDALTKLLQIHLDRPEAKAAYIKAAPEHLAQYERARIIPPYAAYIEETLARWKGRA